VNTVAQGVDSLFYTNPATGCKAVLHMNVIQLSPSVADSDICAWRDTIPASNSYPGGIFTSTLVSVINLGGGAALVAAHAPGIATITYTIPLGCATTKTITVNALPSPISGNYIVCNGSSATLTDASPGGSWSSSDPAVATIASGTGLITGMGTGTVLVTYTLSTGCKADTTITVIAPPSVIGGANNVCLGATTILTDSVTGGLWSSGTPSVAIINPLTGALYGLSVGTSLITYNLASACQVTLPVTVNPLPTVFTAGGGGSFCAGGAGLHITLSGSQSGVSYQLYNGTTAVGLPVAGTGSALDMGIMPGAGVYTIIATNTSTSCANNMTGSATINVNPLPTAFGITGGGPYCAGGDGAHIGLGGSVAGVTYQLYLAGAPSGVPVAGTGAALDFGLRNTPGAYTAKGTNTTTTCTGDMAGSATISITPTVAPAVTISVAGGDTVCTGTPVTFTPAPVNGGFTPAYQWLVNSINTATGPVYVYTPANADVVSVVMTSSANCPLPATASAAVVMSVVSDLVPSVTVIPDPGTSIIKGQEVTFTVVVTGGGVAPSYQWAVNSVPQPGATNSTFSASSLNNGDVVSCAVTSDGQCGGHTGSGQATISVVSNVGVTTTAAGQDWSVLPNPGKGELAITGTLATTGQQASIEITDVLGQVVYKGTATPQGRKLSEHISLGKNIANGMYLLTIRSADEKYVFHIVIER
jgi:hypothetical protein